MGTVLRTDMRTVPHAALCAALGIMPANRVPCTELRTEAERNFSVQRSIAVQ